MADDILGPLTPSFIQRGFGRRLGYAVVTSRGFKVRWISVVSVSAPYQLGDLVN